MNGIRTRFCVPFRYGGIMHDYYMTIGDWDWADGRKCWCCGNVFEKGQFPYMAAFRITKGLERGHCRFRLLCRDCAYRYGVGVVEMDGNTYMNPADFDEKGYKAILDKLEAGRDT